MRPVVAGSAEEAVLLARQLEGKFDLLLSDLVMPGKGGVELATTRPRGATYLQKPFTRDSLLPAVAEQLAA